MAILGSDSFYVVRAVFVVDSVDLSEHEDWANATQTLVTSANVQPFPVSTISSKEENRDRSFEQTLLRIYAPAATDVRYTDRILFDGVTYDVFGNPNEWRTFSGAKHHLAFLVRLRSG